MNMENPKIILKEGLSQCKCEDDVEITRVAGSNEGIKDSKKFYEPKLTEEMDLSPIDTQNLNCLIPLHDKIFYHESDKTIKTIDIFKGLNLNSAHEGYLPSLGRENAESIPFGTNGKVTVKQELSAKRAEETRPLLTCAECKKSFLKRRYLVSHMRAHTGYIFHCAHCPFKTRYRSSLVVHMVKHTGKYFSCEHCPKKYCCRALLKQHVAAECVRSRASRRSSSARGHPPSSRVDTHKPFRCSYCPFESATMAALVSHTAEHAGRGAYACELCPFHCSSRAALATHSRTHSDMPNRCPSCHLKFKDEKNLEKHLRAHGDDRRFFACPKCTYRSRYKSNLKSHVRAHDIARHFSCPHCSYAARYRSNLNSHVANVHSRKSTFSCHVCPFVTRTVVELAAHMRMHVDESPSVLSSEGR